MDSNAIGKGTETICEKYHSSISQNTAHKHISGIIEKIDPQKKYAFLEILENTFKNILSCSTCKCLLKNNSSAFNCGHTYCEQCSVNLDKCPTCKDQGKIRTAIKDFSKILDVIGEIKSDFNSDRFLYEVIRFLLFGSKIPEGEEDMDEATSSANNNTPPITHQSKDDSLKKSRKLASKIKKQKTPLTAGENSRKRLKFDKTNTPRTSDANLLENDSENLFVETVKTRKSYGRKTISYLETQPALSEINAGGSSTSKRKRETDLQSDSSVEGLKRAKKKTDSESPVDSDKRLVSVRLHKIKINSETSSPELQCQGESKHLRALEPPKKSISMLEAVKSTVGEMRNEVKIENAFATVRDADTEELDLDVWKRNDKNDKKKRLFKSVKERNKRDVSISGTLDSLLDRQKFVNKETPSLKGNPQESTNEGENIPTNDPSKGQPISTENSSITNTPKAKQIPIQHPQINHSQKETKSTPKKMIPLKVEKNTKNTSPVETTNKTLISLPLPEKIHSTERTISPAKVPINVSKLDEPTSTTIPTETTTEILAEDNRLEKAEKPKPKKLGLPLFADSVDPDIFSQKATICSSTPCGPTKFKVSKTYSKVKNKLFDKTIADLSPIVERKLDHFDVEKKSMISPLRNKHDSPALDDSLIESSIKVQAEVHEAPVSQCDQPVLKNKPVESPLEVTTCESQPAEKTSTKSPTKEKIGVDICKPLNDILAFPSTSVEKTETKVKETSPIPVSNSKPIVDEANEVVPIEVDDVDKELQSVDKITTEIISTVTPQKVAVEEPVTPYKESSLEKRRNKVKKLQQEINTKNEKLLSDLKKNFNRVSPKLSIERVKNPVNASSSKSPNCGASEVSEKVVDQSEEKNELSWKAKTPETRSPEIPPYDDTIPTQKYPTPRKHVACQTSDDLLEDLLKEKFPHLLEKSDPKSDYPSSVYDTPMEQNNDAPLLAKTPDLNVANKATKTPATNTSAKYTLISSITSSEKKFAEKHFMNDSVLCDSPFTIGSANKTGNVSGYAPLTPEHRTEEKKKLSCRLNFITDTDDLLANFPMGDDLVDEHVKSPVRNAEVSPETNEVAEKCDDANSADAVEQHVTRVNDKSDEVTDRSNEIVFNDSINDKIQELCDRVEQEGVVASASILENTVIGTIEPGLHEDQADEDKTFFESDSVAVIPDTEATIFQHKSPTSSLRRESNVNGKIADKLISCANENDKVNDDKIIFDDDDDIDFVAGTPTSQPARFIGASLEKNKTPRRLFDQIPQTPLSGLAVKQNVTPNISFIEPLADISRFSNVKQPNPTVDVTPTLERNDEDSGKVSVELLNSDVLSNSTSFDSIHVSTSGLKEPDLKVITKFCEKFGAIYSDKLNDKSTHLVVKIDENNKTARTFKFLQAIVSGVRIVSMNWVRECLATNKIVSETKFIPLDSSGECGPLRTYNLIKGLTPSPLSWLRDYCIYFTEPVPEECTLEQLQGIMRKTGAIVLNSITEFKKYPNHHHIIIVSEEDEDDEDVDECVEKNSLGWKVAEWYKIYRAVAIEFNWMLEVIGRNKLVPFADYEVREYPPAYLLSINFPAEMLKPDEDSQTSD